MPRASLFEQTLELLRVDDRVGLLPAESLEDLRHRRSRREIRRIIEIHIIPPASVRRIVIGTAPATGRLSRRPEADGGAAPRHDLTGPGLKEPREVLKPATVDGRRSRLVSG